MIFVIIEIVCIPTGTSSALGKKKTCKESLYIVLRPEPSSNPPFGSDQEEGGNRGVTLSPSSSLFSILFFFSYTKRKYIYLGFTFF